MQTEPTQCACGSQAASVSQSTAHAGPEHAYGAHEVDVDAGQAALLPSQLASATATPLEHVAGRQGLPAGANPSAGQEALAPSQLSARSQGPTAGRQARPAGIGLQVPSTAAPAET